MLVWRLRALMADKGIGKPLKWLVARDFGRTRANQLVRGQAKEIKVRELAALCRYLRCGLGDLFAWQDDDEPLEPGHPLLDLETFRNGLSVSEEIPTLHAHELKKVRQLIDEMKQMRQQK